MGAHTAADFRHCRGVARAHYENFPVASAALPRTLRDPVAAIYVFARTADDLADEGTATRAQRLAALDTMASRLEQTAQGRPPAEPAWRALARTIENFALPSAPFHDLLSAFRQDVTQAHYADFAALRDYCRRSADPVGRLLLRLIGADTPENITRSDRICTALQLLNFLQDLQQDFVERGRLYIPRADLERFGVSEQELARGERSAAVAALLGEQIERAAAWLYAGRSLPAALPGRLGVELRLIVRGGWRTVERLRKAKPEEPFARPRLGTRDRSWILAGLLRRQALPDTIVPPARLPDE